MQIAGTARQVAKMPEVPLNENQLRGMIKRKECPGFYTGNRFYIRVDLLMKKLDEMSVPEGSAAAKG